MRQGRGKPDGDHKTRDRTGRIGVVSPFGGGQEGLQRFEEPVLNYRHHFHAGNFADLVKHALLLALLGRMTADDAPLQVIDTHAGAGLYDLEDAMARRSKEAEAGVLRLMADADAPAVFDALKRTVEGENGGDPARLYPGSPLLIVKALRAGDRYRGYELRPDDQAALQALLRRRAPPSVKAEAVLDDGYGGLSDLNAQGRRLFVLIDPPFERGDEYHRIVLALQQVFAAAPAAVVALWTPLKDLETLDALLRRIEALSPPSLLVAETRLRPLVDPMKMNGCAMVMIGAPEVEAEAAAICGWVAARCGAAGAEARVYRL